MWLVVSKGILPVKHLAPRNPHGSQLSMVARIACSMMRGLIGALGCRIGWVI